MLSVILASVPTGGGAAEGVCPGVIDCPPEEWFLLALWVGGALFISFTCSLLEAVVMSVDKFQLRALVAKGDSGAARMLDIKENRTEDAIAAILSLNTVAHTVGATLSGAQALKMFGNEAMAIFSAILTILILVLTEIIPKNAGERYPEKFSNISSLLLQKLIMPTMLLITIPNRWLVNILYGEHEEKLDKAYVEGVADQAIKDGALDNDEGMRIKRVMSLTDKTVKDIMIGRLAMPVLPATSTLRQLSEPGEHSRHARILVGEDDSENILGYVFSEEAFHSVVLGKNTVETSLADAKRLFEGGAEGAEEAPLIREINYCKEDAEAKRVLQSMLDNGTQIALVYDEEGSVSGMITLEEFLEYLLDEDIRDEDDPLVPLQALANQRREQRVSKLAAKELDADE